MKCIYRPHKFCRFHILHVISLLNSYRYWLWDTKIKMMALDCLWHNFYLELTQFAKILYWLKLSNSKRRAINHKIKHIYVYLWASHTNETPHCLILGKVWLFVLIIWHIKLNSVHKSSSISKNVMKMLQFIFEKLIEFFRKRKVVSWFFSEIIKRIIFVE